MSLATIRLFCDVAQEGNFSRAAALNGVTQSAASQRIRVLEGELGVELIDRSTRPCKLTEPGRIYFEGCQEILERYERLERDIVQASKPLQGHVDVASIYSADIPHLNEVRGRFSKEQPEVAVQFHYLQPQAVRDAVRSGKCDFGILSYADRWPELAAMSFREETMIAVFAPGHRLSAKSVIEPSDLVEERLIGFDANLRVSQEIRSYLRQHGVRPVVESSFDNVDSIKAAVAETGGVGILPERTVPVDVARGLLAPAAPHPTLIRPLAIVHSRDEALSPAAETFVNYLRAHDLPATAPAKSERPLATRN